MPAVIPTVARSSIQSAVKSIYTLSMVPKVSLSRYFMLFKKIELRRSSNSVTGLKIILKVKKSTKKTTTKIIRRNARGVVIKPEIRKSIGIL